MLVDSYIIGLGGTFDHLHEGHRRLLEVAFSIGEKIIIGLAKGELLSGKKFRNVLQSFETRKETLVKYATSRGRENDMEIVPLTDPFGPAITSPQINMHVSSEETIDMARKINIERKKRGLEPLILVVVPMVLDNSGSRFRSTTIREQIIKDGNRTPSES